MTYGCVPLSCLPDDPHGPPDHPAWRIALVDRAAGEAINRRLVGVFQIACKPPRPPLKFVRAIMILTALEHGLEYDALFTKRRNRRVAYPRMRAWRTLRNYGYSLCGIGNAIGYDHTSILSGIRRIEYLDGLRT